MFFSPSAPEEVSSIIRQLKDNEAIRSNDIARKFLKLASTILAPYLSSLFNLCLTNGCYPEGMKVAEVVQIFKKGDPNNVTNYRPISLSSNFNKILEKLLTFQT